MLGMMELFPFLKEYAEKQAKLISLLKKQYKIKNNLDKKENLKTIPWEGEVVLNGTKWRFQRHGLGVKFVNSQNGEEVDPLVQLNSYPEGFDAWRIFLFLESKKLRGVKIENKKFSVSRKSLIQALQKLDDLGKLSKFSNDDGGRYLIKE